MNGLELLARILVPIFLGSTSYRCGHCGATFTDGETCQAHVGRYHGDARGTAGA